jgi:ribonuclease HI
MKKAGLQIALHWMKAQAGKIGNELADTLAKKVATNGTNTESYTRIPKSAVLRRLKEENVKK